MRRADQSLKVSLKMIGNCKKFFVNNSFLLWITAARILTRVQSKGKKSRRRKVLHVVPRTAVDAVIIPAAAAYDYAIIESPRS